jgi:hypothetical protein
MVATDGGPAPGLPLKGEEKGADGCRRVRYAKREWICSKKKQKGTNPFRICEFRISNLAGGLVFKVLDILIIEERFFNSSDFGKIVQKLVLFGRGWPSPDAKDRLRALSRAMKNIAGGRGAFYDHYRG